MADFTAVKCKIKSTADFIAREITRKPNLNARCVVTCFKKIHNPGLGIIADKIVDKVFLDSVVSSKYASNEESSSTAFASNFIKKASVSKAFAASTHSFISVSILVK
jgi:hypothetical protein